MILALSPDLVLRGLLGWCKSLLLFSQLPRNEGEGREEFASWSFPGAAACVQICVWWIPQLLGLTAPGPDSYGPWSLEPCWQQSQEDSCHFAARELDLLDEAARAVARRVPCSLTAH